ncbi:hypothetical protein D3C76_1064290 [compost metagenome]
MCSSTTTVARRTAPASCCTRLVSFLTVARGWISSSIRKTAYSSESTVVVNCQRRYCCVRWATAPKKSSMPSTPPTYSTCRASSSAWNWCLSACVVKLLSWISSTTMARSSSSKVVVLPRATSTSWKKPASRCWTSHWTTCWVAPLPRLSFTRPLVKSWLSATPS